MDPKKGGGALLDIGIYPLFFAYYILGLPKNIKAQRMLGPTGVDIQTSMILEYENALAMLYCGIANPSDNNAKICGTKGQIILPGRWHDTQSIKLINNSNLLEDILPTVGNGFTYQIKEVNRCIIDGKKQGKWSLKNSLELGSLLEKVKKFSD